MPLVTDSAPDVLSPAATAALLLAASSKMAELGLPRPTVAEVVQATGASRSRAYELKERLEALLAGLVQLFRCTPRAGGPSQGRWHRRARPTVSYRAAR